MNLDAARTLASFVVAAFAVSAASPGPALAQAPELTFQGGWSSGPGAGEDDAETGWGLVRVGWGDLVQLRAGGFELQSIKALDLFPGTFHVECVATLARSPSPA